jgi:hypothetical protein
MKKLIAIFSSIALFLPTLAFANQSGFPPTAATGAATTTVAYMTPGTATTTVTYDAYNLNGTNQAGAVHSFAADSALAFVQFAGSSTSATLNVNEEYSQNNIDWFQGSQTLVNGNSTTTLPDSLTPVPQYQYAFASSTSGLGAVTNANSATTSLAISIPTPSRYIRLIFSLKIGGTNGAVWALVLPKKENP